MKKHLALAILLVSGMAAVPALADDPPICLQIRAIDRTTVVNPKTILFRMKDGKVYRNAMRTACLGLKFHGFVYRLNTDEICGSESIRVLNTDEVCTLGKFTPETIGQHG
ncbi:MAG: hypothetical protein WDN08_21290 [Rhizomicrobium sp.]